jgi:glycosyltransferase involved in cell wall biosynthesis
VVDGREPANIAAAQRRLAADEGLRRQMGSNARSWAERFDWQQVYSRTAEALRALS